MRIKSVKAWWVRIPIETSRQHRSDFGQVRTFDAAILRIETDDGLVGWGEGKNAAGSAGDYGALVHMLNHEVGPQLIGRHAGDIGVIWEMLYNGVRSDLAVKEGHAMPQMARRGMTIAAISAVDIALWDILGKSLGEPVWRLLGGRKLERMPAYASGGWASGRQDRRAAPFLYRQGRLQGGQDARRRDGRRAAYLGRARAGRAQGDRPRYRADGRCARHLHGRRRQALHPDGRRTATSPGSRSRSSPTTSRAWPRCAPPATCRSPPARARRRATPSAISPCSRPPTSSSRIRPSAAASARR